MYILPLKNSILEPYYTEMRNAAEAIATTYLKIYYDINNTQDVREYVIKCKKLIFFQYFILWTKEDEKNAPIRDNIHILLNKKDKK